MDKIKQNDVQEEEEPFHYQMISKLFCRGLILEKRSLFKLAAVIFINNLVHHLLILLKRCLSSVLRKLAESGAQAAKLELLLLFQPVFTAFKR